MTKQYRSREGETTVVDTKTQLTTLGSETAPGPLLVPQGVSTLLAAIVAACGQGDGATQQTYLVRLEGPGLPAGPEVFAAGASGVQLDTTPQGLLPATKIPLGVPVTPGNEILVFAEMCSEAATRISFCVTLIFS